MSEPFYSAAAHVEALPFGSDVLIYSPRSGATALLNEAAFDAWSTLCQWQSRGAAIQAISRKWDVGLEEAQQLINVLVEGWHSSGFFDGRRNDLSSKPIAGWPCAGAWQANYSLGRRTIRVRTASRAAGRILDRVLYPMRVASDLDASERATTIDLLEDSNNYSIVRSGRRVWGPSEFAGARHMLLRELITAWHDDGMVSAVLHAGAVSIDDRCVVLAGDSGVGKSTLLAGLVCMGAGYVADDLLGLNAEGTGVFGFPAAISVKPGSDTCLKGAVAAATTLVLSESDEFGLRYLNASSRYVGTDMVPVSLLCFPQFSDNITGVRSEILAPSAALKALLDTGTRVVGRTPSISGLVYLAQNLPAIRLAYSDWTAAADYLGERLSE